MSELTNGHRTETVHLTFVGPAEKRGEAIQVLAALGFADASESVDWREALPFSAEEMPGAILAAARAREGLTQKQLAEATGIPQRHLSEMENSRRSIGRDRAKRLAEALRTDYRVFL